MAGPSSKALPTRRWPVACMPGSWAASPKFASSKTRAHQGFSRASCAFRVYDAFVRLLRASIPSRPRRVQLQTQRFRGGSMRITILACSILLLSGLAAAQATVIGGTASYWAPPYIYAAPFVPLITTPSVSWVPAIPTSAGARNATWGNVAGARISAGETVPTTVYDHPYWNGGGYREFHGERAREMRHEEGEQHE